MSSTILRNGVNMITRSSTGPVSILKKPQSPTPFPFHATFSVLVSPQASRVQFPASPNLVSTFTTHSSEAYDRAPIKVSPNPLAMPPRGDRYYSPSMDNFTLAAPPKRKSRARLNNTLVLELSEQCASPAITEFADPRSPKPTKKASEQQHHIQFQVSQPERPHSLSVLPRSPYPQANPIGSPIPEGAARSIAQRSGVKKSSAMLSVSSPLTLSFTKPSTTSSLQRRNKPAPLDLEPSPQSKLVESFWDAVTLEGQTPPMVTALEYPPSAELVDVDLASAAPAPASLMFGNQDGSIWSPAAVPAAPKSASLAVNKSVPARESLLRAALLSPGVKASFGNVRSMSTRAATPKPIKHSLVASPSPHDPYASFQSFAAVMSMSGMGIPRSVDQADACIAYPAPVAMAS